MTSIPPASSFPGDLSDRDLLTEVERAVSSERGATAHLLSLLIELDTRRLYLGEGFSSLFTYCTQALHLSEHAAYNRIEAARAARRCPIILELIGNGAVTLTAVRLLAPHLTIENHREVLAAARHRSKRDVEQLVARLHPQPDVPAVVRYRIQFTTSRETYDKLRRAQALLRHAVPDGDPASIVDRALTLLISELERTKIGATNRPPSTSNISLRCRAHNGFEAREYFALTGLEFDPEEANG